MERLNISQLNQSAIQFEGVYRASSCRSLIACTGKSYLRFSMEDSTGCITAYEWQQSPSELRHFDNGSHLHICGSSRCYNGSYVADIMSAEQIMPTPEQSVATLPFSQCPKPEALAEFVEMICGIRHDGLRSLLANTFCHEHIALPFMQVPASLKYHHNFQGGLLVHSMECAQIIQDLSIFSQQDRELGMAAALLHDLGKIKTIGVNFSRPELGKAIDHDAITLELCSSALAKLDMDYPDLGIDLRHILTCRSTRRWGYEPKLAIAHAVQLADRLSSDRSLHRTCENHEVLPPYQIAHQP
jgi:3'-5' exoribonuclease